MAWMSPPLESRWGRIKRERLWRVSPGNWGRASNRGADVTFTTAPPRIRWHDARRFITPLSPAP